jgi:hypothetical protein
MPRASISAPASKQPTHRFLHLQASNQRIDFCTTM